MRYLRYWRYRRNRRFYKPVAPKKRNEKVQTNIIIFAAIVAVMLFGVVAGALYSNFMDSSSFSTVNSYISNLLGSFDKNSINQKATFVNSLYKYTRVITILWVSGFFVGGIAFIVSLLIIKAFTYGFTTAALVRGFGYYGFIIALNTYVLQNLFILSALLFVSINAVSYIYKSRINKSPVLPEYIFVFLIGMACCLIAALIETFVTPALIDYLH